jgi:H/ACA ribonucleoprotein complex subunit 3
VKALKKCAACLSYTMKDACAKCGGPTISPHPARFSPEDRYGAQRRELKRRAGLL